MSTLAEVLARETREGELYDVLPDGRLQCYACGHCCPLPDGAIGVCRVRFNEGGKLLVPWGYVGGVQCDPIEKKPFFHAHPGALAYSFGMLGCDLHCAYCQNWVTSQALRDPAAIAPPMRSAPDDLVRDAIRQLASVTTGLPWHVTAFHGDYKMTDPENPTPEMLLAAAAIGRASGLRYVYAGNLPGQVGDLEDTHCASCGDVLIARYGYHIRDYRVTADGRCPSCAAAVPGRWSAHFDGQITSRPFIPGGRRFTILNSR